MESVLEKKLQHQSSTPKKLDINYLRSITKNFSEDQILGHGGCGIVYKGERENGEVVAVKKLKVDNVGKDDKQFMNEVIHAMDICHPNIVRLEGYCCHTEKEVTFHDGSFVLAEEFYRLLCFEYIPNGSLDKYLSDESSGLDWHVRYNIIEGVCNGLHCLHEGRNILHLDLKPANILLDENKIPKIADFGLSRLIDEGKTHIHTKNLAGTCGYMAPEYIERYVLSKESDIYSLGVIIIEIVTGERKYPVGTSNEEFVEVYEKWRRRLQATRNKTSLEEECQQVNQCIEVGLKCMDNDPKRRPSIREVVQIIKRSENIDSCSVTTRDGKHREESVYSEWSEKINILVLGSSKQSIEAMETICHELKGLTDVPEYIIKDADRLVLDLTMMVEKSFNLTLAGASSMQLKHALNTLFQIFKVRHLAQAMKEGTLEKLVTQILIWISSETVLKTELDDARELLKALNVLMLHILTAILHAIGAPCCHKCENFRFSCEMFS